jgi:hypothetical protein
MAEIHSQQWEWEGAEVKHKNDGKCAKCTEIMNRYDGLYGPLRSWFTDLQARHPEAHVACAGRGEIDQESLFKKKATRARFGKSAHNYNAALDLFENGGLDLSDIYELEWFTRVIAPAIPPWMEWYGKPGSSFFELPHVEVKNWRVLAEQKRLHLVRGGPDDK